MSKEGRIKKKNEKDTKNAFIMQIMNLKMKTILQISIYSIIGPIAVYTVYSALLYYHTQLTNVSTKTIAIKEKKPIFWIYAKSNDTGYLKHVFAVLARLGFERGDADSDWDLLWAHDYPFRTLLPSLKNLETHQRINHFPGCGYITNKVDLSTTSGRYIPAAFKIPEQSEVLLKYASENSTRIFVEKSNDHRGISIKKINDLNLTNTESFVQEFIQRPFLVDGFKFDIGVYTVISSIDPLRVYVYKADVLFRFCPIKYYPFDPEVIDKYIVGDDYLPIWEVPSLAKYYSQLGFSMKDSFDAYLRVHGKDPRLVWDHVYESIREITLLKESHIKDVIKRFGNGRNFFEFVRFDFTLDEDLNVYMMEANMSPNLSSAHYPPNQLLYEQVIYNLFALVGIGQRLRKESLKTRTEAEEEMIVANKNLAVFPELCIECDDCFRVECQLCSPCYTSETRRVLTQSYLEQENKMDFQRIFPPSITKNMVLKDYTLRNQLLVRWYQGKCELDPAWCI